MSVICGSNGGCPKLQTCEDAGKCLHPAPLTSKERTLHPQQNRRVGFDCFWASGCSDSQRCNANGSCVAALQAGGATFPQQMAPDTRPLSHMEILSAVAHHASEIARLTAAVPVQCTPDSAVETSCEPVWMLERRHPGGDWTLYYAVYPSRLTAEAAIGNARPPEIEWRVVEYRKVSPVQETAAPETTGCEALVRQWHAAVCAMETPDIEAKLTAQRRVVDAERKLMEWANGPLTEETSAHLCGVTSLLNTKCDLQAGHDGRHRFAQKAKVHQHTDECWEPDSGCDMGRNEQFVAKAAK